MWLGAAPLVWVLECCIRHTVYYRITGLHDCSFSFHEKKLVCTMLLSSYTPKVGVLKTSCNTSYVQVLRTRPGVEPTPGLLRFSPFLIPVCTMLAIGNCTAGGFGLGSEPVFIPLNRLLIITTRYCSMPSHTIIRWRTMTPTAAGLNKHKKKEQNPSYPGSFHRTVLLSCFSCSRRWVRR